MPFEFENVDLNKIVCHKRKSILNPCEGININGCTERGTQIIGGVM